MSETLWYKNAIFYEVHVRAFCDANGDGCGDLQGLISKLDYLSELGVDCLWLLPIYPSPLADDGYDIVDVEVDRETGKVEILRYTAVLDAGRAVHPAYVKGQMQGAVLQGVGWALNEEYFFNEDGTMANSTLLDYRMPTTLDLPMIDTVIVEVPNPVHPYGARGVGETPIVPPLATVANAMRDATGVRITVLPLSPPRVLGAIEAANGTNGKSAQD